MFNACVIILFNKYPLQIASRMQNTDNPHSVPVNFVQNQIGTDDEVPHAWPDVITSRAKSGMG